MTSRISKFTAELRRRRVYRAAYVYVALGLGVLGAAELILDPLGLGAARRAIVVVVLLGFPVALVLSWVYELRLEGSPPVERVTREGSDGALPTATPGPESLAPRPGWKSGRRLAAIMFADMVGYTALMQTDEKKAKENRDRLRRVLTAEIEARDGLVVQFYGDGALSIFNSAVLAVESAIAVQEALRGEPPVPVRIGIHVGDVVHDDEGAFGDGVNVASRIESISVAGGILMSGKVFDEVRNQPGIVTQAMGDFELKNVSGPIPVYAVSNEGMIVPRAKEMAFRAGDGGAGIAVLPFLNMSDEAAHEYFSDGMSEELINLLTRFNGLKVTARTSSFSFKGRNIDVREIGRELGVGHVLEGSVRRSGNRVRISAQLLDAVEGHHLFSETYDRTIEDVFETQDEISRAIVHAIADKLCEIGADVRGCDAGGISSEAHSEYLLGLFHWARWTPEGARSAIAHCARASELDPTAALPHSCLAISHAYLGFLGQAPFEETYSAARLHAEQALRLDPRLGEAHVALALVELFGEWNFEAAYAHFQKALSLNPGAALVHQMYAVYLLASGDPYQAVQEMETAIALDPKSPMMLQNLATAYQGAGRMEDAVDVLNRVLDADPRFRAALETRAWIRVAQDRIEEATEDFEALHEELGDPLKGVAALGYVYGRQGRRDEALEMLDRLEQRKERDSGISLGIDFAVLHAGLGDLDRAVDYLREARDGHAAVVLLLPNLPPWRDLMEHPSLREMYEEIGRPMPGAT